MSRLRLLIVLFFISGFAVAQESVSHLPALDEASRLFEEGTSVRQGQPLYQLDDAAYRASLETARANLLSAQASAAKANADLARYQPLVAADAISRNMTRPYWPNVRQKLRLKQRKPPSAPLRLM